MLRLWDFSCCNSGRHHSQWKHDFSGSTNGRPALVLDSTGLCWGWRPGRAARVSVSAMSVPLCHNHSHKVSKADRCLPFKYSSCSKRNLLYKFQTGSFSSVQPSWKSTESVSSVEDEVSSCSAWRWIPDILEWKQPKVRLVFKGKRAPGSKEDFFSEITA